MNLRHAARTAATSILLATTCLLLTGSPARAATLSFDGFDGNFTQIPNGYGGLNWAKFYAYGHATAATSPPNAALGYFGGYPAIYCDFPFNWWSSQLLSPNGPLTVRIYAYRNGVKVYDSGHVGAGQWTHKDIPSGHLENIDRIEFTRVGGADNFTIDDFTFTWYFEPKVNISDGFTEGEPLGPNGYTVTSATATGLAEVIADPEDASNALLRLFDSDTGAVSIDVTKPTLLEDAAASIEFDYRFLTDGKLLVKLGGTVVDTVLAPGDGDGSSGGVAMAHYAGTFDVATPGEVDFGLELVNVGDPELYVDNIQITAVPEPATLSLLAAGAAALLRRRR